MQRVLDFIVRNLEIVLIASSGGFIVGFLCAAILSAGTDICRRACCLTRQG